METACVGKLCEELKAFEIPVHMIVDDESISRGECTIADRQKADMSTWLTLPDL